MNSRIRFGLIGAGTIASAHADAVRRIADRAVIVAVADPNAAQLVRFGQRHFVPFAYRTTRELLNRDDLDVITICTPPVTHEPLAIEALASGRYVVCEKPLAHTLASADRILAQAMRFPGKLSICFQHRYQAVTQRIKWLAEEEGLGPLRSGRFVQLTPFPEGGLSSWWGRWSVAGGGVVITRFIHDLDTMLHLFGPMESVDAKMANLGARIESEQACQMHVRFVSGATVEGLCSIGHPVSNVQFSVHADAGDLRSPWTPGNTSPAVRKAEHRIPDTLPPEAPSVLRRALNRALRRSGNGHLIPQPRYVNSHQAYLESVVESVENGRALPIDENEARRTQELCTAVYESSIQGTRVMAVDSRKWECYGGIDAAMFAESSRRNNDALRSLAGQEGVAS
jgi:predicted dehydrogenase